LFQFVSDVTIASAVRDGRSFNQLINKDNVEPGTIVAIVSSIINRLINSSYNLPVKLTPFITAVMAKNLLDYPEMSIEDSCVIIKKGVFGEFGKTYNKFDLDTWSEWIDKYLDQRIDEVDRQYRQNKETAGTPNRDSRVLEMTSKMLSKSNKPPDERMFENK